MRTIAIIMLVAALAACESVQTRITRNKELFDSYPAQTQELIRKGQVGVGFTIDQARMALGRPDWIFTETTAAGSREVWIYGVGISRMRYGYGLGSDFSYGIYGNMRSTVGGVADVVWVGEKLRLEFESGKLAAIWRRTS